MPSSGSISSPASGETARAAASASAGAGTEPSSTCRKPSTSGISCGSAANSPSRVDERRSLHERVVGDRRHRCVSAATVHAQEKRRAHLLRGRAEVEHLAAELDPVTAALVDREVGAHRVGMLLHEPLEAEAVTDLLVRGRDEDQVARPLPALPRERGERDCGGGDLALHVERAPPPHLAVDEVAAERLALPLARVGEHDVGVREQRERRAVAATANPRDEVRTLRARARRAQHSTPAASR